MTKKRVAPAALAGLLCASIVLTAQQAPSASDYAANRAERAKSLTQPFGWFSLVALDWLKPGVTTVGSAKDNSVVLATGPAHLITLEQAESKVLPTAIAPGVTLHGNPVPLRSPLSDHEDDAAALASGTLRLWAIDRGGKRYLRVKDSQAPALTHFHGLRWYPPAAHYRVEARWIPYTTPHTLNVLNKLGQVTPVNAAGYVEFELDGHRQTLVPMEADEQSLWFVFRDATYQQTTDGGGRFLTTSGPSHGRQSSRPRAPAPWDPATPSTASPTAGIGRSPCTS